VIGSHDGACFYTVGQRKGLGIAWAEPLYVLNIDTHNNRIVAGTRDTASCGGLTAAEVTWVAGSPPDERFEARVQIRHRHTPATSLIQVNDDKTIAVIFHEPQHGVAPGQAVVVYDEDLVLGGGWITGSR